MSQKRGSDEIDIVDGQVRSFEWFWAEDGSPGLDEFERLDVGVRAETSRGPNVL